ncbi:hypothetical protein [Sphingomonas turrisvirgatae]|uniref:Uncharacterized protein n=1 Tax=Sphingomonas turrisvirgatae TaxID=1888892 RepID=A0A1E3LRP5_9SPHN|nr:hypothetical protein [Sphingomonas turrisvirgatae]ODP36374.1 hypothetical protein BFL28_06105 [Sphingomonas turrisvirgatae]
MTDPNFYLVMSAAGLAGLGMVTAAGLAGWRGWLQLKRQELHAGQGLDAVSSAPSTAGARIEIADLKERIRKLEAIAAGVDL